MKKLTLVFFLLNLTFCHGQQQNSEKMQVQIIEFCHSEAQFPGGWNDMRDYFSSNLIYPMDCLTKGISGTVWVNFTIEKDGSITEIEICRGVYYLLDAEAMRLIRQMPRWDSESMSGRGNLRTRARIPITFEIIN